MPPQRRKNIRAQQFDFADNQNEFFHRERFTIAQVNAGATILPAIPNKKYRVTRAAMIGIGGAPGAATTIEIKGTRAGATVNLLQCTIGVNFTQSKLMNEVATGSAILADGASFTDLDDNTAVTIGKTGADVTTATNIDVLIGYQLIDQHVVASA